MRAAFAILAGLLCGCAGCRTTAPASISGNDNTRLAAHGGDAPASSSGEDAELPGIGEAAPSASPIVVHDPLEPVNRVFFVFNDKVYDWVLTPSARRYRKMVTEPGRRSVRNFFSNLTTPVRFVNCLLQARFKDAGAELARLGINTTLGVGGFSDAAKDRWDLARRDADFGQTLGVYGLGPSIYITWPFLGPSSLRDSVGYASDLFLDPVNYAVPRVEFNVLVKSYSTVNDTSLRKGEYEQFRQASLDPYVALRDAYYQYRRHLVEGNKDKVVPVPGPLPP